MSTTTACTGTTYPVNPDAPEEGDDLHHAGLCPEHDHRPTTLRVTEALSLGSGPMLDAAFHVHDEYGSGYRLTRTDDGSQPIGTFDVLPSDGGRFIVRAGGGTAWRVCDHAKSDECDQPMTRYVGRSAMRGTEAVWIDYACDHHAAELR